MPDDVIKIDASANAVRAPHERLFS